MLGDQLTSNLAKHARSSCCLVEFHEMPNSIADSVDSLPFTLFDIPCLSSPCQGSDFELVFHDTSEESIAFNDCYAISSPNFKEMIDLYYKSMNSMTQEEINLTWKLVLV